MKTLAAFLLLSRRLYAPLRSSSTRNIFKGSVPEYVAITVDRDGQVTYQEAKEDDNPIKIQLDRASVQEMFDLTRKAGPFSASPGIRLEDRQPGDRRRFASMMAPSIMRFSSIIPKT